MSAINETANRKNRINLLSYLLRAFLPPTLRSSVGATFPGLRFGPLQAAPRISEVCQINPT